MMRDQAYPGSLSFKLGQEFQPLRVIYQTFKALLLELVPSVTKVRLDEGIWRTEVLQDLIL